MKKSTFYKCIFVIFRSEHFITVSTMGFLDSNSGCGNWDDTFGTPTTVVAARTVANEVIFPVVALPAVITRIDVTVAHWKQFIQEICIKDVLNQPDLFRQCWLVAPTGMI